MMKFSSKNNWGPLAYSNTTINMRTEMYKISLFYRLLLSLPCSQSDQLGRINITEDMTLPKINAKAFALLEQDCRVCSYKYTGRRQYNDNDVKRVIRDAGLKPFFEKDNSMDGLHSSAKVTVIKDDFVDQVIPVQTFSSIVAEDRQGKYSRTVKGGGSGSAKERYLPSPNPFRRTSSNVDRSPSPYTDAGYGNGSNIEELGSDKPRGKRPNSRGFRRVSTDLGSSELYSGVGSTGVDIVPFTDSSGNSSEY